ncbi:hypothetical protein KIN20_008339 [Parelaphostrongylus tenuis]|uniref:G-protein coupled receptors family 1 profile domain-containing protein n=1 Tax=Parelaphostrongylus tenuis TaxID=148309 RepID=A0AAD5MWP3_PARTN|nr:hypothetical protein KIN20_008339 [Parelaphostrongylus tenuis]
MESSTIGPHIIAVDLRLDSVEIMWSIFPPVSIIGTGRRAGADIGHHTVDPAHARTAVVMERALPPLTNTILASTHGPWHQNDDKPSSSATPSSYSTLVFLKTLLVIVVLIVIIVTIVGNALVCLAVLLVRKLKQPANFLIVSLAIADFFVGLLVMPLALVDLLFAEWPLSRSMCKLWTTADLTLCTASIVSLCAISVDRYLVITQPLRYSAMRTTPRMLIYIVIVWVIAAVVSLSSHIIANLLDTEQSDGRICQVGFSRE